MLVLTFAAVAIAFSILRNQEDGPTFADSPVYRGGPARTGQQPGPGPSSQPTERWRVETDGRTAPIPVLADGVLYFGGDDGVVWAVDAETGQERWRFTAAAAIGAPPAAGPETVYVGDRTGMLYALDRQTGTLRWQASVLTSAEENAVRANGGFEFDASSAWTYSMSPVEVDGVVFVASGEHVSAPAVADGLVVIPNGYVSLLRAFDAATGAPLWRFPATENDVLSDYAEVGPGPQAGVFAIDAASGQQRWYARTSHMVIGTPAIDDGVVYVGTQYGTVFAVDAQTGATLWVTSFNTVRSPYSGLGIAISASPAIADGVVYVGSADGTLHALDATTGANHWDTAIDRFALSSVVVADGMVYVVSNGALHAVDAQSGEQHWQIELGNNANGSVVVAGGLVFVGMVTEDGKTALVALGSRMVHHREPVAPLSARASAR
jgi:outer membrane protein assembly factor BamB